MKIFSGWVNYLGTSLISQCMNESEMGLSRIYKSAFNNVIYSGAAKLNNYLLLAVKEQRVDGSCIGQKRVYAAAYSNVKVYSNGSQRDYQIRILSNLINKSRLFLLYRRREQH